MIYRVVASMLFIDHDEAVDFFHDCQVALPKASVIHPCQDNQEFSVAELQECHHDETPSTPCTSLEEIDNAPVCSTQLPLLTGDLHSFVPARQLEGRKGDKNEPTKGYRNQYPYRRNKGTK